MTGAPLRESQGKKDYEKVVSIIKLYQSEYFASATFWMFQN